MLGCDFVRFIDLRSDTVTQPTDEMRKAMLTAEVGDDVYGDDPTMVKLEKLAAEIVGKEAALFVPSGTMGNQLAIMSHTRHGDEIILGEHAHIVAHEVGAAAALSGVSLRTIKNSNDFVYASDIKRAFRPDDIHMPKTGLVCLENALSNGTVVPLDVMKEAYDTAKELGVPVHTDGARLFNAAAALGVSAGDIAENTDSIMFCLSKGLCAPVGSILAGTKEFIDIARKKRKMLGGGMRQVGFLAACGIIALEKMTKRLDTDHRNAKLLATKLTQFPYVSLDMSKVQINMVFFSVDKPMEVQNSLQSRLYEKGIKINGPEDGFFRFVTNNDVLETDIDYIVECFTGAMK